jgi:DNA-binding MarR family transcriptional regulator
VTDAAGREDRDPIAVAVHRLQRLLSSRRVHQRLASTAGADLTQQAAQVLRVLESDEARSVAEVARLARMDVAAVSRQLRILEDCGLATRRTDPCNASALLITATAAGAQLAGRIQHVQDRHLREALAGWTAEERAVLGELLLRFVDDLQRTPYRDGDRS